MNDNIFAVRQVLCTLIVADPDWGARGVCPLACKK